MSTAHTPEELARIAADRLNGTCMAIYDLGEEFEEAEIDAEFCAVLDQLVFCCEQCGWWFEQSEMAEGGEWICEACAEA